MTHDAPDLTLTKSQAACLAALRLGKDSKPEIAVHAKLDFAKTTAALGILAQQGLATQDGAKKWRATARGMGCGFETVPDRRRRNGDAAGPGGRRLLALLDRPMRGPELAGRLGVTRQRTRELIIKLHARGLLEFADPDRPFWVVMRAGDTALVLSREEERVLSALSPDYATDADKIRLAVRTAASEIDPILQALAANGFAETVAGFQGQRNYRLSADGLNHPQYVPAARRARAPRLPAGSDRVCKVLSAIRDSDALRIRDVTDAIGVPHSSINALMQYLKRKQLVRKTGEGLSAPYALTDQGRAALAEMTRRRAA